MLGKTKDAILNFSAQHHFDLIIMGTKGAWGIHEILSGSETQLIARKSKAPLLSLRCDQNDLNLNHLLFVYEFNNPVKEDMTLIHKLTKAFDTKIHFLQITSEDVVNKFPSVETSMRNFAELNDITNYPCHLINDKDVENGGYTF